jgi:hypothetical protein
MTKGKQQKEKEIGKTLLEKTLNQNYWKTEPKNEVDV